MDKSRNQKDKPKAATGNTPKKSSKKRSRRAKDEYDSSSDDPDYQPEDRRQTRQTTSLYDKAKKFLNKKKADIKFKTAGPGHKLTSDSQPDAGGHSGGRTLGGGGSGGAPPGPSGGAKLGGGSAEPRKAGAVTSEEKRQAAAAALARLEKQKKPTEVNEKERLAARQMAFVREQARREIEAEMKLKESGQSVPVEPKPEPEADTTDYEERVIDPANYAVKGVFYTCPIIGPEVASKEEIEQKIRQFLRDQPEEELAITSCLMILSCNKSQGQVNTCIDILCKYIDNIVQNPDNPKVRKIRLGNKAYQEKVAVVEGATQFLKAAGFTKTRIRNDDTQELEDVWLFQSEDEGEVDSDTIERITELRDTLKETTPIKPELDRNLQVLMPAEVKQRKELPAEFYQLTVQEIKREQQLKTELAERELTLRTKAQREKDELRTRRIYRYCVMRIRFPDGFTLQGTFWAHEKLADLYEFVRQNLVADDLQFHLRLPRGEALAPTDATLAENRLPPASILVFNVENPPAGLASGEVSYLKPEIVALVRPME